MKTWILGLAVAGAVALSSAAKAETVKLDYLSLAPALTSGLRVDFTGNTPSSSDALGVGAFKWKVLEENGDTFTVGQFIYTFCIQGSQTIGDPTTYTLGGLSGAPSGGTDAGAIDGVAAAQIQGLISTHFGALDFTAANGTDYVFNAVSYSDNEVAAAMQLAIWEIEYDGGTGGETFGSATNYYTNGLLRAASTNAAGAKAIGLAAGWLNSFVADDTLTSMALLNVNKQDQLIGIPNPRGGTTPPVVPLPAALPAGLGTLGLIGLLRKLRRR